MIRVNVKKNLHSSDGHFLLDVNLEIRPGEFVSLYGKSGAGKTSLLRMIAGLTTPQEGMVEVNGDVWFDSKRHINRPVQKRPIGFVFQEYTLFPHMTLRQNLEYALGPEKNDAFIDEYLQMTGLKGLDGRRPDKLSGGQKQRAALVRALLRKPSLLLLDEPLSALDIDTRLKLQDEILKIHRLTGVTTILVSHDLAEVFKLSGRIFMFDRGVIVRSGELDDVLAGRDISGKFKFVGRVLEIVKDSVVNIVVVQIGQNITRVVASDDEAAGLKVGDTITVAAKAFNPIIIKANSHPPYPA